MLWTTLAARRRLRSARRGTSAQDFLHLRGYVSLMTPLKNYWVNWALGSRAQTERLAKAWQESLIASANFSAASFTCFCSPSSIRFCLPVPAL